MKPSWMRSETFCVFDLETTSVDVETARIVQIALLRIEDGVEVKHFETKVNPECEIPEESSLVHGITNDDVKDAPTFSEMYPRVLEFAKEATLCGYNAALYDLEVMRNEMKRAGMEVRHVRPPVLDPLVWVREIDRYVRGSGRHQLEATAKRWKVKGGKAHDALSDCRMTWGILEKIADKPIFPSHLTQILVVQMRLAERQQKRYDAWRAAQDKAEEGSQEGSSP